MTPRLIDFAVVVLQLLMFKVYENIGITKIELFSFPENEGVQRFRMQMHKFKNLKSVASNLHI